MREGMKSEDPDESVAPFRRNPSFSPQLLCGAGTIAVLRALSPTLQYLLSYNMVTPPHSYLYNRGVSYEQHASLLPPRAPTW